MEKLQLTLNRILEQSNCFDDSDKKEILLNASVHVQNNDITGLRKYITHVSRIVAEQQMLEQLMQTEHDPNAKSELTNVFELRDTRQMFEQPMVPATTAEMQEQNEQTTDTVIECECDIYAELEQQEVEDAYFEEFGGDDGFEDDSYELDEYTSDDVKDISDVEDDGFYDDFDAEPDYDDDEQLLADIDDDSFDEDEDTFDEDTLLESLDDGLCEEEPVLNNIDVDFEDEESLLDSMTDESFDEDLPISEDERLLASMPDDDFEDDSYLIEDDGFEDESYKYEDSEDSLLDGFDDGFEDEEPLLDNIDVDYDDEDSLLDSMSEDEFSEDFEENEVNLEIDDFEEDSFEEDSLLAEYDDDGFEEDSDDILLDSMEDGFDDIEDDELLTDTEDVFDDELSEFEDDDLFEIEETPRVKPVPSSKSITIGAPTATQLPDLGLTPTSKMQNSMNVNSNQGRNSKNNNSPNTMFKDRRANSVLKLFGLK